MSHRRDPVTDAIAMAIIDAACDAVEEHPGVTAAQVAEAFKAAHEVVYDVCELDLTELRGAAG